MKKCPKCIFPMRNEIFPDVELDICEECSGIFFEAGELDGQITAKTVSVEDIPNIIEKTSLDCPNCSKKMDLATLALVTSVQIEYCSNCKAFFFDKGEFEKVNCILREDSSAKHDERYRRVQDGRLVKLIRQMEIIPTPGGNRVGAAALERIYIYVYFRTPLKNDLYLARAHGINKILKYLGLKKNIEVSQISDYINDRFVLFAKDAYSAEKAINYSAQQMIENIDKGRSKIYQNPGEITIYDNCLRYSEGRYHSNRLKLIVNDSRRMRKELLELAKLIDRQI